MSIEEILLTIPEILLSNYYGPDMGWALRTELEKGGEKMWSLFLCRYCIVRKKENKETIPQISVLYTSCDKNL